jgi:hypothetical protein
MSLINWFLYLTLAAERTEERKLEEQLLDASREGDLPSLNLLVSLLLEPFAPD